MNKKEQEIPMPFEQWVSEQRRRGLSNEEIRRIYWREFMERRPEQYGNAKERETHLNDLLSEEGKRRGKELARKFEEQRTLDEKTGGRLLKEIPALSLKMQYMTVGKTKWFGKKKAKELLKMANEVMEIVQKNGNAQNEYIAMSVADLTKVISDLEDHLESERQLE